MLCDGEREISARVYLVLCGYEREISARVSINAV